jgi:YD repeat-containing protein
VVLAHDLDGANLTAAGLLHYDANDRITTDAAEQYDAAGNTTSSGSFNNVYDFENKLVRRGTIAITYDGDGNRVSKTVGGVTAKYMVDTNRLRASARRVAGLDRGAQIHLRPRSDLATQYSELTTLVLRL